MKIVCPKCNAVYDIPSDKIPQGKRASATCKECGGKIVIEPSAGKQPDHSTQAEAVSRPPISPTHKPSPLQIKTKDFIFFIGPKSDKYLSKFKKFNITGVDKFSLTWHWPAFFFSFLWMLYRKLYLWALLAFVLSLIPYFGFLLWVVWGATGNYIYYKNAKKKILRLKTLQPASDLSISLRNIGGVNEWVWRWVKILLIISILALIAAILIPLFAGRSY